MLLPVLRRARTKLHNGQGRRGMGSCISNSAFPSSLPGLFLGVGARADLDVISTSNVPSMFQLPYLGSACTLAYVMQLSIPWRERESQLVGYRYALIKRTLAADVSLTCCRSVCFGLTARACSPVSFPWLWALRLRVLVPGVGPTEILIG